MSPQFDDASERAAHTEMLRRIRAEQIAHEPAHEPSWVEDQRLCDPVPHRVWCCDWHEFHDHEPHRNTVDRHGVGRPTNARVHHLVLPLARRTRPGVTTPAPPVHNGSVDSRTPKTG